MSGFDLDHEQGRGGPRHSLASETTHVSLVGTTVRLVVNIATEPDGVRCHMPHVSPLSRTG